MCGGIFGNERMTTVCSRTTKKQNSCWTMKAFSGQVSRISPKNRNFGWFSSSANEIKPNWSTFCVVPLVIKNWNFAYQTVFISQACRFCRFLYIEKSHNCTSNVIPPSNSNIKFNKTTHEDNFCVISFSTPEGEEGELPVWIVSIVFFLSFTYCIILHFKQHYFI